MAYVINALIADIAVLHRLDPGPVVALALGFGLFPLTKAFWFDFPSGLPLISDFEAAADGAGQDGVADTSRVRAQAAFARIEGICTSLSEGSAVAYIEAELWAGDGPRAAAAWVDGRLTLAPTFEPDPINAALRTIGVRRVGNQDEFATVDLGRHRFTEAWVPTG